MAGHSKWANIKRRKGAQDAKRGKIFTKLIKEITVAVKTGGGPDPETNPRLRLAVQNARGENMPNNNIDRAIKKAAGDEGGNYTELTYEGYGPDGVAIFVECATDNNTRTVGNVRSYFNKYGGNLGKDGCLEFFFDQKGVFIIENVENKGFDEDEMTLELIEGGAEEVEFDEEWITITTEKEEFGNMQKKLQDMGIEPKEAGLQRIATTLKSISKESFPTFMKLIEALEDDDDVQKVYHNVEYDESLVRRSLGEGGL